MKPRSHLWTGAPRWAIVMRTRCGSHGRLARTAPALPFEILAPAAMDGACGIQLAAQRPAFSGGLPAPVAAVAAVPAQVRGLLSSTSCSWACVDHGAPMLRALVPRSYIDLNREPYELDPRMFSGELPGYANTGSPRVAGGLGTIPRIVSEGEDIYRGRLDFAEARAAHRADLRALSPHPLRAARMRSGQGRTRCCWSTAIPCRPAPRTHVRPPGEACVDVVLGDRFGASCAEDITGLRRRAARSARPAGAPQQALCRRFHHPEPRRARTAASTRCRSRSTAALYMNEATLEKTRDFWPLAGSAWTGSLPPCSLKSSTASPTAAPRRRRIKKGPMHQGDRPKSREETPRKGCEASLPHAAYMAAQHDHFKSNLQNFAQTVKFCTLRCAATSTQPTEINCQNGKSCVCSCSHAVFAMIQTRCCNAQFFGT